MAAVAPPPAGSPLAAVGDGSPGSKHGSGGGGTTKPRRLKNMPKFYQRMDAITLADLQVPPESDDEQAAGEGGHADADAEGATAGADGVSKWAGSALRAKVSFVSALQDAAQKDSAAAPAPSASENDRLRLLGGVSEQVDELVHILSDWDADFKNDGVVSKRDFRRALALLPTAIFADRGTVDHLFDFLQVEEMRRQGKLQPLEEAAAVEHITQEEVQAPSAALAAPQTAASWLAHLPPGVDLLNGTLEIWQLDRALRWAEGSRAKRSKLLTGQALEAVALLQDNDKSVQENLRDTLVHHALRVMDLFREWDADGNGEITKEEFRKALPMLGLHATKDAVDELFEGFDTDDSGSLSFRELNRQLRRDVKAEEKKGEKVKAAAVDIIDVNALRQTVRQGLMSYSNFRVDVHEEVDPITGMRKMI